VKVRDIIKIVEEDGWVLTKTVGSHRQYKHPAKKGKVTIPGHPNEDMPKGTAANILRQAQLKGMKP
jgi:predicted RNA binding protein YcfA (HicA-like mRNA interferase family)